MRRKSARNAAKASPEKAKKESPARKPRRQSKRRKRSTSESSEDSQDDRPLNQITSEVKNEAEKSHSPSDEENATVEQPVWKVTPANTATGEIQKLKICLTRPSPSTPERTERSSRRYRNKSGEDSPDEKPRRTRYRGSEESSTQEDEKSSEMEEKEERRGKGKSKGKHKSKVEKTAQLNEAETEMQSEISENVQVTPQSPSAIAIPVDNDESVNTEVQNVPAQNNNIHIVERDDDNSISNMITQNNSQKIDQIQINEVNTSTQEETETIESQPPMQNKIPHKITTETTQTTQEQKISSEDDRVVSEAKEDRQIASDAPEEQQIAAKSPQAEITEAFEEQTLAQSEMTQSEETADDLIEKASVEAQLGSEIEERSEISEVPSSDVQFETFEEVSDVVQETEEDDNDKTVIENEQEASGFQQNFAQQGDKVNESIEQMDVDVSETEHFKNLKSEFQPTEEETQQEAKKPPPKRLKPEQRKRKWGVAPTGLNTIFTNVLKIDLEAIKELCPDLKFLDENEVRLEAIQPQERKKSIDQKATTRKVSVEETEKSTPLNSTKSDATGEEDDDSSNIIALNRKISIVDDTASKLKPPPSPAKNPLSAVLFITNLVRPFTLKQLKELLERTGKIKEEGFWTDRIKSKCYVYYESVEEAEATRNALHGVQWPIGNGKKLIIDYSTPEDLENARNPPPPPAPIPATVVEEIKIPNKENEAPMSATVPEEPKLKEDRRERRRKDAQVREWDIGKEDVHRNRSRSRERAEKRKHGHRSHTPIEDFITRKHKKLEEAVPQKMMDDLFQKTKATPCIYWQPLTPEEIATKQQQRLLRMAEHKRRMEETSRNRGNDFGRGAPYRRRHFPG